MKTKKKSSMGVKRVNRSKNKKRVRAGKVVQLRFLKVNPSTYIFEEFDGKNLKEMVLEIFTNKKTKDKSVSMFIGVEKTGRRTYQDGTAPASFEEYKLFRSKVDRLVGNMKFDCATVPLIDPTLVNKNLLIYTN